MRCLFIPAAMLVLAACREPIQHGLDERQANEVQAVLAERGFEARKVAEGGKKPAWSIEVPGDQSTDAVRILSELGLPRPRAEGISELFGKGSLVPSAAEERALYQGAIRGELSKTLEAVDGVVSARVHLVLPPSLRPGAQPGVAKASVFLKVRPGQVERVNRMRDDLRALVAGGVESLAADQVTLVVSEVSSAVASRRGPSAGGSQALRLAIAALGATVSVLSLAMVWMVLRQRAERVRRAAHRAVPGEASLAAVPTRTARRTG